MLFKLAFKNLIRYPIRSLLTMVGVAVAILSFGILSTVVDSWSELAFRTVGRTLEFFIEKDRYNKNHVHTSLFTLGEKS